MPDNHSDGDLAPSVNDTVPCIAQGLHVNGDIKGSHDLYIEGVVTGSVFLPDHEVRVGAHADVHANITARIIEVSGNVAGDLKAVERVVIRGSSTVEGDILAPQIQLEEGCHFKGSVQMREPDVSEKPPTKPRLTGVPGAVSFRSNTG